MHKFKPGQKVVCVGDHRQHKGLVPKIPVGDVVIVAGFATKIIGNLVISGYEKALNGDNATYKPSQFAPLIETDQFVEVTFTKVAESAQVGAN